MCISLCELKKLGLGRLETEIYFYSFGGEKSNIQVPTYLVPGEVCSWLEDVISNSKPLIPS
jgi:hypothetical protein